MKFQVALLKSKTIVVARIRRRGAENLLKSSRRDKKALRQEKTLREDVTLQLPVTLGEKWESEGQVMF